MSTRRAHTRHLCGALEVFFFFFGMLMVPAPCGAVDICSVLCISQWCNANQRGNTAEERTTLKVAKCLVIQSVAHLHRRRPDTVGVVTPHHADSTFGVVGIVILAVPHVHGHATVLDALWENWTHDQHVDSSTLDVRPLQGRFSPRVRPCDLGRSDVRWHFTAHPVQKGRTLRRCNHALPTFDHLHDFTCDHVPWRSTTGRFHGRPRTLTLDHWTILRATMYPDVQPIVGTNTRTLQDGRKTSRSQEIDTCSFHEEAVSSDRTGQPVVETSKAQTRSSDDSKSLNVEMAHDRTRQPVVETNTENVPDGCQRRSCHESISFDVGDETIRDRTGQPVVNHDEPSHEQTMLNEVNIHFQIPGLPHSVVQHAESSRVRELVKKIREPPRSTCSSTRSTTKQSLQPV